MTDFNSDQLIELFDGRVVPLPEPSGDAPSEGELFAPPFAQNAETNFKPKNKHRKNRRPKKRNGVWALPIYKHTFDTYKECRFRFRKCNRDSRDICREVTGNLKRMMVNIELFLWQVKPASILSETLDLCVETIVTIRAMKDFGELNTKDFSIICQYSSQMLHHMMKWNAHHNGSAKRAETDYNML